MKIVDIFLAAPKAEARGVIATLLDAHGFEVRWLTPWSAQGDRGSSFAHMFNPGVSTAKFTVVTQMMGIDEVPDLEECVVRLERRSIPTGQNQAAVALRLADEFENLCDEVVLAFSSDGRVRRSVVYGAPPLVVVDARLAKPPPPILPGGYAVVAAHAPPAGPPWTPGPATDETRVDADTASDPTTDDLDPPSSSPADPAPAARRRYPPPPPLRPPASSTQ